ncbi:unnamed protein product [Ostreobium quekettii]|uniref:Alcohol dehydrogenase-like N-terminal domain-containing protein n=1 Tax=Ostreobium quekettii TaxID=121088 RepID=A0A8S1IZE8_9CHLO|nr:unnamed protein product [Ostreobium quekettii]
MDGPPRRAVAALAYKTHGEPSEVLSQEDYDLPTEIGPEDVKIKMLASPINPADLNTVEGKYPLLPQSLPAVGGHEGVGEIISIGAKVSDLTVGDWVVPLESGLGTWREAGVFKRTAWHKVPRDLPLESAATMSINPPTALCLLEKFAKLHKGDVIVQNGANSTVGQCAVGGDTTCQGNGREDYEYCPEKATRRRPAGH